MRETRYYDDRWQAIEAAQDLASVVPPFHAVTYKSFRDFSGWKFEAVRTAEGRYKVSIFDDNDAWQRDWSG